MRDYCNTIVESLLLVPSSFLPLFVDFPFPSHFLNDFSFLLCTVDDGVRCDAYSCGEDVELSLERYWNSIHKDEKIA